MIKMGDFHKSELFALAFGQPPCAVLLPTSFMTCIRISYNTAAQLFFKGVIYPLYL